MSEPLLGADVLAQAVARLPEAAVIALIDAEGEAQVWHAGTVTPPMCADALRYIAASIDPEITEGDTDG